MKGSKSLYFLLPAVLFVWGLIGYRFMNMTGDTSYEAPTPILIPTAKTEQSQPNDRELVLDYPDPFLSNPKYSLESDEKEIEKSPQIKEDPYKNWAPLKYQGQISHSKRNNRVAIVEIAGTRYLMELGDDVLGYELVSLNQDSVRLAFQQVERWVKVQ